MAGWLLSPIMTIEVMYYICSQFSAEVILILYYEINDYEKLVVCLY